MSGSLGTWPAALGCPLRAAYAGQADAAFSTVEVADGPPRHRLITDMDRRRWTVEFAWTDTQVQVFESWVAADLGMGLSWFRMPQLTGAGMTEHFCHLVGDYTIERLSDSVTHWRCAFEVEAIATWPGTIPPIEFLADYDARRAPDALPTDIVDAMSAASTPPADRIDALVPGA
jgi:hypothetical protein